MQIVKGMVPWAAAAMDEIDLIAQRLKAREHEADPDRAWREEWARDGRPRRQVADTADAGGPHDHRRQQLHARRQLLLQRRALHPAGRREDGDVSQGAALLSRRAASGSIPNVERVDVPYEGKSLAAYFMKAPGVTGRAPTVVLFDGMDNCKEMSVIFAGLEFAKRGIHTLAIDGPGQGETQRLRNIHSRPDYEVAGTAAYDYVAARPEVDPKRVAVMGYSFGGYHAPRICRLREALRRLRRARRDALEHLRLACRREGAARQRRQDQLHLDLPVPLGGRRARQRDRARMGEELHARRRGRARSNARSWSCTARTTGSCRSRRRRRCTSGSARRTSTLKIFTAEEGGAEHCQVDHRQIGVDYIGDWLLANM